MFLRILYHQAKYKWGINLLIFLALTSVVGLYVYLQNTSRFANRSMQLIMKNMGHNLIILPEEARPTDTYLCSGNQVLFSEEATREFAKHLHLASKYYVSVLQKKITIDGGEFILTGIEPVRRKDETPEKGNMIDPIQLGHARLSATAAREFESKAGSTISVLGREFLVTEILLPKGTIDDFRIYINLQDCQDMLNRPDQINAILAFACLHVGNLEETNAFQSRELNKIRPGFKQITKTDIFQGRYLARATTSGSLHYILMIVLAVVVLLIAITGLQEVSERRRELGIFVSLGASYFYIAGLYFAKILILALAASFVGFYIGSQISLWLNTPLLIVNTSPVRFLWNQLPDIIYMTCSIALIAELLPIIRLLNMDPAATLIEE